MKNRLVLAVIVAAFAGSALLLGQVPRSADVQFKAAQHKEEVEGDLEGAIRMYQQIAEGGDRALAARALLRMAECHEKLGNADAQAAYERVVRDFGDLRVQPGGTKVAFWYNKGDTANAQEGVYVMENFLP